MSDRYPVKIIKSSMDNFEAELTNYLENGYDVLAATRSSDEVTTYVLRSKLRDWTPLAVYKPQTEVNPKSHNYMNDMKGKK